MAKRCIGIDVNRSHIRAVQIARTSDGFRIEQAFGMQTRRSTDSPPEILRSLVAERGFDRRAEIVISLPHSAVFFADLELESAGLQRLRAGDSSMLKDDFPIPSDQIVVELCSVRARDAQKQCALVGATSTEMLDAELKLLEEGRLSPTQVHSPATAIHKAVTYNHPEAANGTTLILSVDEEFVSLIVVQDGNILMVRNIPGSTGDDLASEPAMQEVVAFIGREIEITWKKLFDSEPDADLPLYLVSTSMGTERFMASLEEKLNCRTTVVDLFARLEGREVVGRTLPACVAEGLALCAVLPDRSDCMDFLAGFNARTRPQLDARKEGLIAACLLAGIIVAWMIGLFVRLSYRESQYADLRAEIRDVFGQTVPEEKNVVNPLAQLRQKLDSFKNDYELYASFGPRRAEPLDILKTLGANMPAESQVKVDDLAISTDSVRITGRCDSFGALSEWQRVLEKTPGFEIVDVQNPKKESGKVHFTLLLAPTGRTS